MKNIKNITKSFIITALALMSASCDKDVFDIGNDPFKGKTYLNETNAPIATFLESQEDFTEYVKVLKQANMFSALNQSTNGVSFTAFAPTNSAMYDFYQTRGVKEANELGEQYARSFVLFHTVKDSILPENFILKNSITNLSEDQLSVAIDDQHAGEAILNGEGKVVQMGLSAYNGKVYVLSKAMTPLVETVLDRIITAGNSTLMVEAIKQAGWEKMLNTISDTIKIDKTQETVINKHYYTLLNVTDEVFKKAGINTIADLKNKLREGAQQEITDDSLLRRYVSYHIMPNAYTTDALGNQSGSETTRIWNTAAKNQVFTVTLDSNATVQQDKYIINASGISAKFTEKDINILAKNGYVHNIDNWLPIWEPAQTKVVWDLADYSEIKSMVPAEDYQPKEPTASENRYRVSAASCFTYEMGESGSSNHGYSDIDYVTCKANIKDAVNNDRIVFNIGDQGWVEMTTPTLIKGKYKIELSIVYLAEHNFMRQQTSGNGGRLKVSFDDNENTTTFTAPYTKVTGFMPGIYTSTLYDEIEFDETAAHKLKFIVQDAAASKNNKFSLQFDCITFTPIE